VGIPLRVLMIEDSEDDAVLLLHALTKGGYQLQSLRVETPAALESALASQIWDVVISDYALPHFSGPDALRLLRSRDSDLPFLFVSGTIGEETAVEALRLGAQDYVMKTNLNRLVTAVQRALQDAEDRRKRKQMEQQVQQLQKFEAIGKLAGGIAHDFNNVLGSVLGWAEIGCEEAPEGSTLRERFQKIRDQAQWAARLTSQLLAFARRQVLQPRNIDLNSLVVESASMLRRLIGEQIEVSVVAAPGLQVARADRTQIEQVLMNLCLNARDAMPNGGRLVLETQNAEIDEEYCRLHSYARPGSYVLLVVSDTGSGMDAATASQVFEPFFTTKQAGKGTGLGLATVYGIVKQHGGFIHLYSEPGQGTAFRIYLPAGRGVADALEPKREEKSRKGTETILLAEDNEGLQEAAKEMLERLGYRVTVAHDGIEAVQLFRANPEQFDLIILDMVMPGASGPVAFEQIVSIRSDLRVVFSSGYTAEVVSMEHLMEQGASILTKPYTMKSLGQVVRAALDKPRSLYAPRAVPAAQA
jgi:two-component system cell cycle sensor histidine kinase/response regulator CckA